MNQEQLGAMFRASELQRREARRKIILNQAALETEAPAPEEKAAIESLQRQSLRFQRDVQLTYWRRLWYAIINKRY